MIYSTKNLILAAFTGKYSHQNIEKGLFPRCLLILSIVITVMILRFRTYRPGQTVQTQIRGAV